MECEKCWLADRCNRKNRNKDFCLRRYKLDSLYGASLLSEAQRKKIVLFPDADDTDLDEFLRLAEIQRNIVEFVEGGKNLYLYSKNCGNGKTSWGIKLLQEYLNVIWPAADTSVCHALFVSVPRFLLALKDNISNKNEYAEIVKQRILEADLVLWDDIAAKVGTDFELNHLLSLIDGRISLGKSNIYTSNLRPSEIYGALGDRIASRICQFSYAVELHGADKRNMTGGEE